MTAGQNHSEGIYLFFSIQLLGMLTPERKKNPLLLHKHHFCKESSIAYNAYKISFIYSAKTGHSGI